MICKAPKATPRHGPQVPSGRTPSNWPRAALPSLAMPSQAPAIVQMFPRVSSPGMIQWPSSPPPIPLEMTTNPLFSARGNTRATRRRLDEGPKNQPFQQLEIKVAMEIGSLSKIAWSENPAGYPRISLESQPLPATSPLVGGVLDPRRHLSMQLLYGLDIRRMWDGLNSGKQPVQGGYQFPKWGFSLLPVFEG